MRQYLLLRMSNSIPIIASLMPQFRPGWNEWMRNIPCHWQIPFSVIGMWSLCQWINSIKNSSNVYLINCPSWSPPDRHLLECCKAIKTAPSITTPIIRYSRRKRQRHTHYRVVSCLPRAMMVLTYRRRRSYQEDVNLRLISNSIPKPPRQRLKWDHHPPDPHQSQKIPSQPSSYRICVTGWRGCIQICLFVYSIWPFMISRSIVM